MAIVGCFQQMAEDILIGTFAMSSSSSSSLYTWVTCVRLCHYELRWIFTANFSVNDGLVDRRPYFSRSTHRLVTILVSMFFERTLAHSAS